jgi:predicted porin
LNYKQPQAGVEMNKKILSLAVASIIAAPMAATAGDVTTYGKVHISIDSYSNGGGENVQSRASRLGFKGSEDLGGGLKAIWKMEFQIDMAADGANSGGKLVKGRNMYIGLNGGWGTFLYGRHDTPFKMSTGSLDLFADTLGDYNATIGFQDIRADKAIAYVSPSMAGFTIAAAVVAPNAGTADGIAEGQSIAVMWKGGAFKASVAYESLSSDFVGGTEDDTKYRLGGGATFGAFTVTGIYEDRSDIAGVAGNDATLWQIQGKMAFGNNAVKAFAGNNDFDSKGQDYDSYGIAFDHNFSKRTQAYVMYTDTDNQGAEGFSFGMVHKF